MSERTCQFDSDFAHKKGDRKATFFDLFPRLKNPAAAGSEMDGDVSGDGSGGAGVVPALFIICIDLL